MLKKVFFLTILAAMPFTSASPLWADETAAASRTIDKVQRYREITEAVGDALNQDRDVAPFASGIQIKTFDRIVILRGFVPTEKAKYDAENVAESVPGVARVINQLDVTN
jgi:osmotically-inducible protein OsmY